MNNITRFLSLFLILSSTVLSAQKDSLLFEPYLELGMHYHYTQTRVEFLSPSYGTEYYQGFDIGLSLRQASEKLFGFQLEIGYTKRGWEEQFDTLSGIYQQQIDYLQITPMTQVSIGKQFYIFLNAGPYLGIPLSNTESFPVGLDETARFYYKQPLARRWQYGLIGGPGFGFRIGTLTIQLEGRYLQGFSGVFAADLLTANSSRPNAIGFGANIFWRL